jgi:hypothetical protein
MLRKLNLRAALIGVLICVVAFFLINFVLFLRSRDTLPSQTYFGELDVSGETADQAITRTLTTWQQPVILLYQGQVIPLQPETIDFKLNSTVARFTLNKIVSDQQGLDKFPKYLTQQIATTRIAAPYNYDETKLRAFLADIAKRFDKQPIQPQADVTNLKVAPPQGGMLLNLDEAGAMVINALASSINRTVDLPVDVLPTDRATIPALAELLQARLEPFNKTANGNLAAVYIKDLRSGEELSISGDTAFSAVGWLRVAVALEAYRSKQANPQMLDALILNGDDGAGNNQLTLIGGGDPQNGVGQVNGALRKMGLVSSFIAQPFGGTGRAPTIVTPANSRANAPSLLSDNAQTTPIEMGLMLESLDQCRKNGGSLPLVFGNAINAENCNALLATLGKNNINAQIELGSGSATVIHRQSWDDNNHGDAAIVRSPSGDYILVVMLRGGKLNWTETSSLIADVARATYGYFNNGQVPLAKPTSPNAPAK